MLHFVRRKIRSKKCLNLCLLAGIALLVAVFSCHPMFEKGAGNQILQSAFVNHAKEWKEFPASIGRSENYELPEETNLQSLYGRMDAYEAKWQEYIALDAVESIQLLEFAGNATVTNLDDNTRFLTLACLRGMKEHMVVADGVTPEEWRGEEGVYPCVMSEKMMDTYGMVVGERLAVHYKGKKEDEVLTFEIAGIVSPASDTDYYWDKPLSDYEKTLFLSEETMDALVQGGYFEQVSMTQKLLLNYTQIDSSDLSLFRSYLEQFHKLDGALWSNFLETLQEVEKQMQSVGFLLAVLELPCVLLLLLFVYMVSCQILSSEEGEISVLRSRGVTRLQIVQLYLTQSVLLSVLGICPGLLLGFLMCKLGASTDGFLMFTGKDVSLYYFRAAMIPYGVVACVIAVLFMTLPVWKRANYTIVEQKQLNHYENKMPFWQKCFLDVLLVAVSLYLYYNFQSQREKIAASILAGEGIDPMIFLNVSLFLFACGLVFLRLCGYIIGCVDNLGKKKWKPAIYASFLQIRRTFYRQGLLSVFLVTTISSGVFANNMARTMNENNEERIRYNMGTDIKVQSSWKMLTMMLNGGYHWEYPEPDYEPYLELVDSGKAVSATRVIEEKWVTMGANSSILEGEMWGIHTKEFGETACLREGLNEEHWFHALNALAQNPDGAIISRNAAEAMQVSVGETIWYQRYSPVVGEEEKSIGQMRVKVVAIVDAFPGYERYGYVETVEGTILKYEKYLVIANYATVVDRFGLTPYSVWMRKAPGVGEAEIERALQEAGVKVVSFTGLEQQMAESRNSALIQVTNGMFTMSFLISLLICSAGFLLYWIMSMKSRELLFGVYRAMGMPMRQINKMLLNEHFFGSLLPIFAGVGSGILGSLIFAKLIVLVYLPKEHNISIRMVFYGEDMIKLLAVILAVGGVCFAIIHKILKGMKIAEALKLGED